MKKSGMSRGAERDDQNYYHVGRIIARDVYSASSKLKDVHASAIYDGHNELFV